MQFLDSLTATHFIMRMVATLLKILSLFFCVGTLLCQGSVANDPEPLATRDQRQTPGSSGGGAVYIRWGRTSCPSVAGTALVYRGRAGGSKYIHTGSGANYICLPDDPEYLHNVQPARDYYATLEGTEYEFIANAHDNNVPCAVCHATTRSAYLMIPAKMSCPSTWTREYFGYLVMQRDVHGGNKVFECVDISPEVIPGEDGSNDAALMYYVKAVCNGLRCPPYNSEKVLTCAVCTK